MACPCFEIVVWKVFLKYKVICVCTLAVHCVRSRLPWLPLCKFALGKSAKSRATLRYRCRLKANVWWHQLLQTRLLTYWSHPENNHCIDLGGSITVPYWVSSLPGLNSVAFLIQMQQFFSSLVQSNPVKLETKQGAVILPLTNVGMWVFSVPSTYLPFYSFINSHNNSWKRARNFKCFCHGTSVYLTYAWRRPCVFLSLNPFS